jgi:hypothetical protein
MIPDQNLNAQETFLRGLSLHIYSDQFESRVRQIRILLPGQSMPRCDELTAKGRLEAHGEPNEKHFLDS